MQKTVKFEKKFRMTLGCVWRNLSMHRNRRFLGPALACLVMTTAAWARDIAPIVTSDWLAKKLGDARLVIVDIRSAEQYKKGHIPGAVSAPLSLWSVASNGLNMELPSDNEIAARLARIGLAGDTSKSIIIVNRVETDFARADATRVAWTFMVAGLKDVGVLDGGYTRWVKENHPVSTDASIPTSVTYRGEMNKTSRASKSYVLKHIGKSIILDARIPEDFFGITAKPGHIKSALNLPTPWVFAADGRFKEEPELRAMAVGVLGKDMSKEILVYCGVGGYASTWWFILTQILGYRNVKVYDGSMEEWILDPDAPVATYSWN